MTYFNYVANLHKQIENAVEELSGEQAKELLNDLIDYCEDFLLTVKMEEDEEDDL